MFNVPPHKEFLREYTFKNIYGWLRCNFFVLRNKIICHTHRHKYILLFNKNHYGVILKDDVYQCSRCQKRILGKDLLMEERKRKIKSIL